MSAQHQGVIDAQTTMFSQLMAQLDESSRRFSRLELDALDIEKLVLLDVQKQGELFSDSTRTADDMAKALLQFNEDLNHMKEKVRTLSLSFKELIKKESVGEIEAKLDAWPLEQFITTKEFHHLLEQTQKPQD